MTNKLTIEDLRHVPIGEIAKYNASMLHDILKYVQSDYEEARKNRDWISAAIDFKYGEKVLAKRQKLQKDTGIIYIDDGGFCLSSDVPKKVVWDQEILKSLVDNLQNKRIDIDDIVEVTHHIPERKFTELGNDLQSIFMPARIVKHGKAKHSLNAIKSDGKEVSHE